MITGISLSNFNSAMTLCAETRPICAAYTTGQTIVAAVCVSRDVSSGQVTVLAPCVACQERLALGVPTLRSAWRTLRVQPDGPARGCLS